MAPKVSAAREDLVCDKGGGSWAKQRRRAVQDSKNKKLHCASALELGKLGNASADL
jgi:hypothetical protein